MGQLLLRILLLILDADGVLVDIMSANRLAWEMVLRTKGLLDRNLINEILSVRDPMCCSVEQYISSIVVRYHRTHGFTRRDLKSLWESFYWRVYARQPLIPGVEEFLRELKETNPAIRIAVATNTASEIVLPKLEPLRDCLDEIVIAGQDGLPLKPDPAPLSYLLGKFGVRADQALMIGDGPNDAGASDKAGILYRQVRGWSGEPRENYKATLFDNVMAAYHSAL